jgi:hypothetical protein
MNKKVAGIVLLVVGILGAILALLADYIGIGQFNSFGTNQIIITVICVLVAVAGVLLLMNRPAVKKK